MRLAFRLPLIVLLTGSSAALLPAQAGVALPAAEGSLRVRLVPVVQ